jgi:hypothetical protein
LEFGEAGVIDVDAVVVGEGIVGLGLAELIDAGGLEGDVALKDAEAGDALGWVCVLWIALGVEGDSGEEGKGE